jgi:hypothetical protein
MRAPPHYRYACDAGHMVTARLGMASATTARSQSTDMSEMCEAGQKSTAYVRSTSEPDSVADGASARCVLSGVVDASPFVRQVDDTHHHDARFECSPNGNPKPGAGYVDVTISCGRVSEAKDSVLVERSTP